MSKDDVMASRKKLKLAESEEFLTDLSSSNSDITEEKGGRCRGEVGCIAGGGSGTPKLVTESGKGGCEPERKDAMFTPASKGLWIRIHCTWGSSPPGSGTFMSFFPGWL